MSLFYRHLRYMHPANLLLRRCDSHKLKLMFTVHCLGKAGYNYDEIMQLCSAWEDRIIYNLPDQLNPS